MSELRYPFQWVIVGRNMGVRKTTCENTNVYIVILRFYFHCIFIHMLSLWERFLAFLEFSSFELNKYLNISFRVVMLDKNHLLFNNHGRHSLKVQRWTFLILWSFRTINSDRLFFLGFGGLCRNCFEERIELYDPIYLKQFIMEN